MSLINDALKKAARQRAEERADMAPPMPGGGARVRRQRAPIRTQTLILVGAAAVALVVVSAVVTGILVTGKPETKPTASPAPTQPAPAEKAPAKVAAPEPVIQVSIPKVAASAPAPAPSPTASSAPAAAPPIAAPANPPPAAPAAAQGHNDQIQGIVDRFHVSGVRAAGADSKALVDGHVYRVNEIIDRSVGLKLVKVDTDHLTFVDGDGATYLKSF